MGEPTARRRSKAIPDSLGPSLEALVQGFAVILRPDATVQEIILSLSVPDGRDGLTVSDLQTVTELQPGDVELFWITKDDRFNTKEIENKDPIGGMPITDLLQLNIGNVRNGPISSQGVPGLVGTLSGTIPMPVTTPNSLPYP